MKFKKIITAFSIVGMLSCAFPSNLYADNISIKYGSQKINYSDTQVKYTMNGSTLKSKYPGIIINGISLASVKEIFADSSIGLSYKYDKKKKTVELKRDKTKLVLTLDSFTAKVNGETEYLPAMPELVEFSDKVSKVYVPARYVAKTFGLTYDWDATEGIVSMTGKTVKKKKDATNTKKGSKKKTNTNKNTKKTPKESFSYGGKTYDIKNKKIIFNINDVKINNTNLPGVYLGKTLMAPAKSLFLSDSMEGNYSIYKSKKNVTLVFEDNTLVMTLGSKTADFNGTLVNLDKAPNYVKISYSKKNEVYIPIENICEFFEIDIETKGNISSLSLPEDDDIEDVEEDETGTIDNKNENKSENKPDPAPVVEKPLEPFTAAKFPFSWKSSAKIGKDVYTSSKSLAGDNKSLVSTIMDINNIAGNQADPFDTYIITSSLGFNGVRGNLVNKQLTLSLDNTVLNGSRSYTTNIRTVNYINTVYNSYANSTDVSFGLVDGVVGYDLSLSKDKKVLSVKIYKNTITEISGSYNKGAYTFNFTGLSPLTIQENSNSDTTTTLAIPNIIDTIGSGSYVDIKNGKLSMFSYFNNGLNGGSINITKNTKFTYYTNQSGNTLSLVFSEVTTPSVPSVPSVPTVPSEPSVPSVPSIPTTGSGGATVSLPAGIDTSEITDEDNYFANNFTITLPGDVRSYFDSNPVKYDNNKVSNVTVSLNYDGDTVLTFYTTKLYAYKLNVSDNQLKIDIDRAKNLYSKVVVIDPGHGGHDTGTVSLNKIYKEKNVVLSIGYTYLRNYLDDENLKVYWTRKDDSFMTLNNRAAFASKVDADLFISIHMNAGSTLAKGTEVYYSTRNNSIQPNGLSSYQMASMFLKNITSNLSMANRGVKSNIFVVTNMNTVPAVLIEYGFLSNSSDLEKFSKLEIQDKSAEILYNTIEEIFDDYPTGR